MSWVNGIQVGLLLARTRMRGVTAPLVLLLGTGAVFAFGVLERRANADSAADHVLTRAVFGSALPVFSYFVSERLCEGQRLDHSLLGVAGDRTARRAALLGLLSASALYLAFASAVLTVAGLLGAHTPGAPGLSHELGVSVGIALIAGVVYPLWFGAASLFGKRGGGRKWALIGDFVLGAGGSLLAIPWPRGHVRNLLGGEPVLGLSQASAWLALYAIGLVSVVLCVTRRTDSPRADAT